MTTGDPVFRCGMAAIIGRPNVGKSTLVNRLVGQKVSIVSRRPQTTRHRILGVQTNDRMQVIYVDTPGLQKEETGTMNRIMNRTAAASVAGVDVAILVITARGWSAADERPLEVALAAGCPLVLAVNKIDRLPNKRDLLPRIQAACTHASFSAVVPLSAATGANVDELVATVSQYLPEQPALFPADQVSDRSDRFRAAEFVREQIFRMLGAELPYVSAVEILVFRKEKKLLRIEAGIWVEKQGHKGIVIGKGGARLKEIGSRARLEMEAAFGSKVFLQLWVKVREGWSQDVRALKSLGYGE